MTLEDVAKRARVSTATVSRVLNGGLGVRPATRSRVLRAIEELNYTPDLNARSLAGGQLRSLGVVVSNIADPFFLDIFRSIEASARQRGYDLIVANTDYEPERLASSVMTMLGRRVAGLALVVSETVPPVVSRIVAELPWSLRRGRAWLKGVRTSERTTAAGCSASWNTSVRSGIGAWPSSATTHASGRCTSDGRPSCRSPRSTRRR
jgi:transcriptional regulator with XRE-family HTH domain